MSKDYEVNTRVAFRLNYDDHEFNVLMLPTLRNQFVKHVKSVYEKDHILGDGYVQGNLNFHFQGSRTVYLDYIFQCHDENKAEAESFSRYSIDGVKKQLEEFGCRITRVNCTVGEMDMSWYDKLEDAIFGPKEPKDEKPVEAKPGKKTSSKKKNSRQER